MAWLQTNLRRRAAGEWAELRDRLIARATSPDAWDLVMLVSDDDWLMVSYHPGLGFHLSGAGQSDDDWFTLSDGALSDEHVEVFLGGNTEHLPRSVFVPLKLALTVTEHYFEHGERLDAATWYPAADVLWDT